MAKRQYTEEERAAMLERLAKARAARGKKQSDTVQVEEKEVAQAPEPVEHEAKDPGIEELTRMVKELQEKLAEKEAQPDLAAAILALAGNQGGPTISKGRVVGTTQKFSTDAKLYPDPRERLSHEPRLQRIAFSTNYELEFDVQTARYETKDGLNMEEPKFTLRLIQIVLDEDGEPTNQRIGKARMIFFEDPATAMEVANRLGLPIDESNELEFLNEMRYMRMREWLFECFWPAKSDNGKGNVREMVVGGQVVEVWEVSSENSARIPFDKLDSKLKA